MKDRIDLGKYTLFHEENGQLRVFRNGEPWEGFDKHLRGVKLIGEMMHEIERLRNIIKVYEVVTPELDELEWSGLRYGQGNGPHGSGSGGYPYSACPYCFQLKQPNNEFMSEAVGHLHTCKLARLLGVATNPPIPGTQEELL